MCSTDEQYSTMHITWLQFCPRKMTKLFFFFSPSNTGIRNSPFGESTMGRQSSRAHLQQWLEIKSNLLWIQISSVSSKIVFVTLSYFKTYQSEGSRRPTNHFGPGSFPSFWHAKTILLLATLTSLLVSCPSSDVLTFRA